MNLLLPPTRLFPSHQHLIPLLWALCCLSLLCRWLAQPSHPDVTDEHGCLLGSVAPSAPFSLLSARIDVNCPPLGGLLSYSQSCAANSLPTLGTYVLLWSLPVAPSKSPQQGPRCNCPWNACHRLVWGLVPVTLLLEFKICQTDWPAAPLILSSHLMCAANLFYRELGIELRSECLYSKHIN